MSQEKFIPDAPQHECGIAMLRLLKPLEYYIEKYGTEFFGLNQMYFLLEKQRHRGQDGAGLACVKFDADPGETYMDCVKSNCRDAVGDLFQQISDMMSGKRTKDVKETKDTKDVHQGVQPFTGNLFLGHLRYSTFGGNGIECLHPFVRQSNWKSHCLLLAGNYNLTNVSVIFDRLVEIGQHPRAKSDTNTCLEHIGYLLDTESARLNNRFAAAGHKPKRCQQLVQEHLDLAKILAAAAADWDGGFTMAGMLGNGNAFAFRDAHGIRPCFWWRNDEVVAVASERSVIASVFNVHDTHTIQEVLPGHALIIPKNGHTTQRRILPVAPLRQCVFERIYFSRGNDPDIYTERKRLGAQLAPRIIAALREGEVDHTVLTFVPQTAEIACEGLVEEFNKLLRESKPDHPTLALQRLIFKDVPQRTFIQEVASREFLVSHAYGYTRGIVKKDTVVVAVDDSIVRGTTLRQSLIKQLDGLGPKKILFCSSAPQIRFPDCYGIDVSQLETLIAFRAAIQLLKDRGMDDLPKEIYKLCKRSLETKSDVVNHVKRIYDVFTDDEISNKISQMVCTETTRAEVQVMFQTVAGLHTAIPDHKGDWVFTGDFPTRGGILCTLQSYVNWWEGSTSRTYDMPTSATGKSVLVIGSGGREHALAWKLAQSNKVKKVFVCPGNGGTNDVDNKLIQVEINMDKLKEYSELVVFCKRLDVSLVVVGPEQFLVDGLADALANAGVNVFGPSKAAVQLEASKAWAKDFFSKYSIPSAEYAVFTSDKLAQGEAWIDSHWPVVVKASGLCAGKGVVVPHTQEEAKEALRSMLVNKIFGEAGSEVVIEKRIDGTEMSLLALCDGTNVRMLPPAQDFKRALDNDEGPNTGGMGAYAPVPAEAELLEQIRLKVLEPCAAGMKSEGRPFVGVLYAGLMLGPKADDINVLEFNCRFGDPETQVLMPLIKGDFYDILYACVKGTLAETPVEVYNDTHACTVVMASGGYPASYKTGKEIDGLAAAGKVPSVVVFHAGTKQEFSSVGKPRVVTAGGRVLCVTAAANTLTEAVSRAYVAVRTINFDGQHFRKDIAKEAMNKVKRNEVAAIQGQVITYLSSGVDIHAGNATVEGIKPAIKSTARPGCEMEGNSLVNFGGFCDLARTGFKDPVLVSGTDGVGTKLKIAHVLNRHNSVGIDLVAMCVNDCLVHGAEPLFFLDYFATGKLSVGQAVEVVQGIAEGCRQAGCALIGGETAEMPGFYPPGEYDLAGFCVAAVERTDILPRMEKLSPGDVVIGLASSGVHSNGFSLVRKVLSTVCKNESGLKWSYQDPAPFNPTMSLGEALLVPTRIYIKSVLPLMKEGLILSAAHITGGGLLENIPRSLPKHLAARLHPLQWEFPGVFRWMYQQANLSWSDMAQTFNCGLGMVLIVKRENATSVLERLNNAGETATIVGELEEYHGGPSVIIENPEIAWAASMSPQAEEVIKSPVSKSDLPHVALIFKHTTEALKLLLDVNTNPNYPAKVVLVIVLNQPTTAHSEECDHSGVPIVLRSDLKGIESLLEQYKVDLLCLGDGGHESLSLGPQWEGRVITVSPSLIPIVDGVDPLEYVLQSNCRFYGSTAYFLDTRKVGKYWAVIWQELSEVRTFNHSDEKIRHELTLCEGRALVRALEIVAGGELTYDSAKGLTVSKEKPINWTFH